MKPTHISDYHLKQFDQPYFSTIAFEKFLAEHQCFTPNSSLLDIGCGCGANIYYLSQKHSKINFVGIDYNDLLIKAGQQIISNRSATNVQLLTGDWFKLSEKLKNKFSGIINSHTLCCFKKLTPAIDALINLHPRWLAFNSLFYEGPLDVLIHIREHRSGAPSDNNPDGDFNIFSLPKLKSYFKKRGYSYFEYQKFDIPVDLPKPKNGSRGTYTVKTDFSLRTQFSGPVYLPWYFVIVKC